MDSEKIPAITEKHSSLKEKLMRAKRNINILDLNYHVFDIYQSNHILNNSEKYFKEIGNELEHIRKLLNKCNCLMIEATKKENLVPYKNNPDHTLWTRKATLSKPHFSSINRQGTSSGFVTTQSV